ncbi:MAG TPA: MjaI family restriction endonuclease [bacterium]|nr:MjaI family restriction endonuclease [bacterium]
MAKEWILNQEMNRWGLNKKKSVGPVSELIRKCSPKSLSEWEHFYITNVHNQKYLEELGKKLYVKISEVIQYEVEEVTLDDCINYIQEVVIDRTYQGYRNEIQTIYGQLQSHLKHKIEPAPDDWDRLFNVDFFVQIGQRFIGIQIKPVTFEHTFEDYKWKQMQFNSHLKFTEKFGGNVFTIFSVGGGKTKKIHNIEVINDIQNEIQKLTEK